MQQPVGRLRAILGKTSFPTCEVAPFFARQQNASRVLAIA